jgi:hypothetical protein
MCLRVPLLEYTGVNTRDITTDIVTMLWYVRTYTCTYHGTRTYDGTDCTRVVPYGTCIRSLSQLAAVYPPKTQTWLSVQMCALFESESCDITL